MIGLCALNTVSVVAPYTAARIARDADKADLILRHSISYVLDTKLTDHAGIPSLFAQLIHAGSDEVIWAERFSLEKYELISHRRDIARRIARELAGQIVETKPCAFPSKAILRPITAIYSASGM